MKIISLRKKLKRWGNNLVAVFTSEDEETYGLKEGDVIDISDMLIQKLPKIKSNKEMLKQIKKEIKQ